MAVRLIGWFAAALLAAHAAAVASPAETLPTSASAEARGPESKPAAESPSWTATTRSGAFRLDARPAIPEVPIGRFHRWQLIVRDRDGRPVDGARVLVGGGMEGHGHGLPTAPKVVAHPGDGVYWIDGVKFTMAGAWTLTFSIESAGRVDVGRIDFEVDY